MIRISIIKLRTTFNCNFLGCRMGLVRSRYSPVCALGAGLQLGAAELGLCKGGRGEGQRRLGAPLQECRCSGIGGGSGISGNGNRSGTRTGSQIRSRSGTGTRSGARSGAGAAAAGDRWIGATLVGGRTGGSRVRRGSRLGQRQWKCLGTQAQVVHGRVHRIDGTKALRLRVEHLGDLSVGRVAVLVVLIVFRVKYLGDCKSLSY